MTRKKLVYFWPSPHGGIAEYTDRQVHAMRDLGISVDVLCSDGYSRRRDHPVAPVTILREAPSWRIRFPRQMAYAYAILENFRILYRYCQTHSVDSVLFATFPGFLTPLWRRKILRLKRSGICFGTMLHDPALDYVVGGKFISELSNRLTLELMDEVFVHSDFDPGRFMVQTSPHITVVPHGPYCVPTRGLSRESARTAMGFKGDEFALLMFGHLRDNKNPHLVLQAIASLPKTIRSRIRLIVAGDEPSGQSWSAAALKALSVELGISEQCKWKIEFVAEDRIEDLFLAADALLLLYSSSFESASGVLSVASQFQIPVIASGGNGPLVSAVKKYRLGPVVAPDDIGEIRRGIEVLLKRPDSPHEWEHFVYDHSWERNAELVSLRLGLR
jgi:glycosyltransferase involved in cell wall biosynthesis